MPADEDLKEQEVELVLKEPAVSDPSPSRWARPGGSLSDQERQLAGKNTIALNEQTTGEKDGDHTTENGNDVAEQNLPLPVLPKQFQLLGTIGHGGMGGVYKVHDVELRKTLAVKVIKPELSTDQAALKRFEQESLALSNLNHPNIVAVFASGKTETGAPYMVMDYIAGQSLSSAIQREGALNQKRAVPLFIEICDALHYAHDKHIIHRDLKPGNIILASGEHAIESARVVDFGIAKVLKKVTGETVTGLTQVGDFFGTPAYMSPEQCEGTQLDARSDIYSFGCVMYETLSGAPPFTEKNPFKLMTKHVEERPALLAREGINPDLALVVAKCLEKKPEDRYQDVDQLMRDLVLIRDGNRPKHLSNKLSKMQLSGLIVMLVCVALGAISFLTPNSSSTTSNPVARLFGNETVPSIEVNTKPSISKPEPVKLTNVEPPPEVPLNGPPLSEEEAAQLKAALYNLTLTNQSTLQPVLQMGKRAIPALLEYVGGDDVGLARAASAVLTKYPKEALPRLVELFKTSDNRFISDTMEQSGGAGLRALSSLLTDSDAGVRTRALSGIADTGKPLPQNVSAIVVDTLLEDVDAETRSNAARAVRYSESPRAKQALKYAMLNDPSPVVRRSAATSLINIAEAEGDTSKETLDVLGWTMQHDQDDQTAQVAIRWTRNLKKELLPYFRGAYRIGSDGAKSAVISQSWDRESGEALLPELIDALGDKKTFSTALYSLRNLGPKAKAALPRMHQLRLERSLDKYREYEAKQLEKAIEVIER